MSRHYSTVIAKLKAAGLRPSRQRLALAQLLLTGEKRHVTAENVYELAAGAGISLSLATVYNTLRQFQESNLIHEVVVEAGRSYYDTNPEPHHHYFNEITGDLEDIPHDDIILQSIPAPPTGLEITRVDVVIRVRPEAEIEAI